MERDPYEVLGVSPDSGPDDWKRAYRRLAMRWHPDRNDHPEATERFKAIGAAYDQLTAVAEDEPEDESETEAETPSDEAVRAPDIRLNLDLTLEEAAKGCRKTIHYTRGKACTTCEGTGEHGMLRTRFCPACHGSGRVRGEDRELAKCGDCGGRGFFSERICPDCEGSGRDEDAVSLKITVPPGMLTGDELRLSGQGEPGDENLPAGDLYLTLVLRTHPLFERRGRDLHLTMPVSALAMLAGGEIEIPTLGGSLSHFLEAGPAVERMIQLAGLGYPGRGAHPAGDLQVVLRPVFPVALNARQRKLLLQANAALLEDVEVCLPDLAAWRRQHGIK